MQKRAPVASRRQEQLLDELGGIVLAEGFSHLQVAGLAARLHCSCATLYKIAPTKEAMIVRAVDRVAQGWVAYGLACAEPMTTGAERVVAYMKAMAERQSLSSPATWRDLASTPSTRKVLTDRSAESGRIYARFLEEGVADGSVRPLNAELIADTILAAARMTRDPSSLEKSGLRADQAMEEMVRFVLTGLTPLE